MVKFCVVLTLSARLNFRQGFQIFVWAVQFQLWFLLKFSFVFKIRERPFGLRQGDERKSRQLLQPLAQTSQLVNCDLNTMLTSSWPRGYYWRSRDLIASCLYPLRRKKRNGSLPRTCRLKQFMKSNVQGSSVVHLNLKKAVIDYCWIYEKKTHRYVGLNNIIDE